MSISSRDVYLFLRAKDDASRVVRGFSTNLLRTAAQVRAAALRAEAQEQRALAQQMRRAGATKQQIDATMAYAKALEQEARDVERASISHRYFAMRLAAVGQAMMAVGGTFVIAGGFALAFFGSTIKAFMDYQKATALTKTQTMGFAASLQQLADMGKRIANDIAVPFEQIQPALYDIFSSTNANLAQGEILLKAFSKAAVAGAVSIQDASRGTMAILNAFNIPIENVNQVLDIQFQLVRKGVGTYKDFATKLGNAIPAAARAQQSFQILAAMLAYLTRNGLSAAMASTSTARALEAISHPKAVAAMEKLGIKVRDLHGNFLPLNESLKSLRDYLMKFPSSERVARLVDIFKGAGGTIQARRFLEQVLLKPGELEEFIGYLNDMNHASGAFQQAYGEMANTAANKTQLLNNRWQVLKTTIGEAVTPAFLKIVDAISKALAWFNRLDPRVRNAIIIFGLLAAAGTVLLGALLVVVGAVVTLVGAIVSAGAEIAIFGAVVTGLIAILAGGAAAFVTLWKNSSNFRQLVGAIGKDIMHLKDDVFIPFFQGVKAAYEQHLKPALDALMSKIDTDVMPVVIGLYNTFRDKILPAAKEIANSIRNDLSKAFDIVSGVIQTQLIPMLDKMKKFYFDNKTAIDAFIGGMITATKWMIKIIAFIVILAGSGAFGLLITVIRLGWEGFMAFVAVVKLLIKWLGDLYGWIKDVASWVSHLSDSIRGLFSNAGSWLRDAGSKIIQGLVDGIKNKAKDVANAAKGIAQKIRDFFPFSPAKTGPLSGRGSTLYAGRKIASMLAKGMADNVDAVSAASSKVAGAVTSYSGMSVNASDTGNSGRPYTPPPPPSPPPAGPMKQVTVHQTINTQEIDPRKHARDLGWELAGRV